MIRGGAAPRGRWMLPGRREINVLALHINEANAEVTAGTAATEAEGRGEEGASSLQDYLCSLTQGAETQGAIEEYFNWNKCVSCFFFTVKVIGIFVCL